MMEPESFSEWAIVSLMGHRKYAGRVTEQVIAGAGFLRIDVPGSDRYQPFTKFIGTGSIYDITPVSEDVAREAASQFGSVPLDLVQYPHRAALEFDGRDNSDERY